VTRPISAAELAELVGRSRSKVSESLTGLATTPGPRGTRLYDSAEALRLLFGAAGALNPAQERARLDKARADMAELELQQRAGRLLDKSEVEAAWIAEGQQARQHFLSMPSRLAPKILALNSLRDVERAIRDAVLEALAAFADSADGP